MKREAESQLLDFCVQQREAFSPLEWLRFAPLSKEELATAALFLAGVDWYGHREQLLEVAGQLHEGRVEKFPELARRTDFSCSRFSSMLRARLRHERAHA